MDPKKSRRLIVGIWLAWILIMLAYQEYVPARLTVAKPDLAVFWTETETQPDSQWDNLYLMEPFLNTHVSWDSEYYLAIATGGYEDPNIQTIGPQGDEISLSYAFFPFYPLVTRVVGLPLRLLGLTPTATSTLSGVVVSALGTLMGMLALYELARHELDDAGGIRAAFYLIIFPSGFFLAQVYTEGLFVGLAFTSLVLLRRGQRIPAATLAVLATFTRAVGVALVIPLAVSWLREGEWMELDMEWRQLYSRGLPWKAIANGLAAFAPLLAFLLWRVSYYGMAFGKVEDYYFGRGLLSLGMAFVTWSQAFRALYGPNSQAATYYAIEWGAIVLGFAACFAGLRRHPDVAWYGLIVILLSFTSGPAQGMHRYVLAAPSVFLFLSRLGRNTAFDRAWSLVSILLMGVLATLFSFDMWTG